MRRPAYSSPMVNFSAMTRKIDVDNRISLRNYYRIADNLLKQANIYKEEKNVIDLYVILLRYSSLVSETIPFHRDYQILCPKERTLYKKKLLSVLDELETLKPKVRCQRDELQKVNTTTQTRQHDETKRISHVSSLSDKSFSNYGNKQMFQPTMPPSSSLKQTTECTRFSAPSPIETQFQKLSLILPHPKQETLSRHSFLGPNGLRGQWLGPSAEVKVNYPTNTVVDSSDFSSLNQVGQTERVATTDAKEGKAMMESVGQTELVATTDEKAGKSMMESVLSLDDGRWLDEESGLVQGNGIEDNFQLGIIRQPSPPSVRAKVQPEVLPMSPSKVADPRPGPPKLSEDSLSSSNSYQDLHIPVKIMEDFLRLARENTERNLETCGVLAGSLRNRVFHITTLIIPKQESTSDSCQTLNEEEIFEVQDNRSLFPLGWIHTHPTQTCFMSSVDLHTHYSYQVMLPEAIAIVMAPSDTSRSTWDCLSVCTICQPAPHQE